MPATPACHGIERAINQHSFSVRGFPSQWLLPLLPCSRARNKNNPETCSVLLRLLHGFHAAGNALPTAHPQQSLTFLRTCDFFPPPCRLPFPSSPLPSLPPPTHTSKARERGAVTSWKTWKTALPHSQGV